MCFQGLFKLNPVFDSTVLDILRKDQLAVVVFMHDPKKESWTELLKGRLRHAAEALTDTDPESGALALTALANGRVHFVTKLPHAKFVAACCQQHLRGL